jgi:hypothetical protein
MLEKGIRCVESASRVKVSGDARRPVSLARNLRQWNVRCRRRPTICLRAAAPPSIDAPGCLLYPRLLSKSLRCRDFPLCARSRTHRLQMVSSMVVILPQLKIGKSGFHSISSGAQAAGVERGDGSGSTPDNDVACCQELRETRPSASNQNWAVFFTFQKTGTGALGIPTMFFRTTTAVNHWPSMTCVVTWMART